MASAVLAEDEVRQLCSETLSAGEQCGKFATMIIHALEASRKTAVAVLDQIRHSGAPPGQLSRAVSGMEKRYSACMEAWRKKVLRTEWLQSVCAVAAGLPSASPKVREADEDAVRLHTGWVLNTKCMHLHSRIALAQLLITQQESTYEPAVRDALIGENGRVRLLGTFVEDVFPAFNSTSKAVLGSVGIHLEFIAAAAR
ncbi:hypothetical protein ACVWW4_004064 [Bradyrhizobium sp. LB7.1]